jgi:hypothetical protein
LGVHGVLPSNSCPPRRRGERRDGRLSSIGVGTGRGTRKSYILFCRAVWARGSQKKMLTRGRPVRMRRRKGVRRALEPRSRGYRDQTAARCIGSAPIGCSVFSRMCRSSDRREVLRLRVEGGFHIIEIGFARLRGDRISSLYVAGISISLITSLWLTGDALERSVTGCRM